MGVAQAVAPQKLKFVQRLMAAYLQANNRWKEAEEAYVKVSFIEVYLEIASLNLITI